MIRNILAALVAGALLVAPAFAKDKKDKETVNIPDPVLVEKSGAVQIDGQKIGYAVLAGETYLKNDKGKPVASIFSTSYFRAGVKNAHKRPVLFIFNGGPGSASIWLHMGVFGPRRVALPQGGKDDGAPPYDIEDNPYTLLDIADLVFIDPVGTGWSRALGKEDPKKYWGVREDARSLAEFIRIWVTKNKRWNSPKYLVGESYGTTRAAALTKELQGGWTDMGLNGVILISSILDFQTARFAPGNDAPHIAYLPTMAATAWYHNKIDRAAWDNDQQAFLDEVKTFAIEDYAPALLRGSSLSEEKKSAIVEGLSKYTGLSQTYIRRAHLRISAFRFEKELLRDEGKTIGRLDGRYTGKDYDEAGETFDNDPSGYGIDSAYTAASIDYFTRELAVPIERPFKVLSGKPGQSWNWNLTKERNWPAYPNVAPWIGEAMRENSDYRVFVASGFYDFATPFFATDLTMNRNGIDVTRVTTHYYQAGHMMYVDDSSLRAVTRDMRAFLQAR
ncbi:MAG: peptidase S10 [Robiginitomaculum sp.]|nr:peptidase S10 [Robiginitomaculum sp.]MDQ7077690.1 peptidase S10 [Robiginitomaculum sp.]